MKERLALKIILWISVAGMLFSGYLSYGELIAKSCYATALGLGACTNVAGIPACIYGFVMYLIVFVISILGLRKR
ncbi:MAG: hypothetical protein AABX17_00065 [Nanoarchaeota archaeon]